MIYQATMLLSFTMSVFLFLRGYWEAIKISDEQGNVNGGTMIFCFVMGLIFAMFANNFYSTIA
jgi:hypothetical protein